MKDGNTATIITYRSATDIDVSFESGYVAKHRTAKAFRQRQIRDQIAYLHHHEGERHVMRCGLYAEIVKKVDGKGKNILSALKTGQPG